MALWKSPAAGPEPAAPPPAPSRRRRRWLPLALAAVLALSACGQEADTAQFSQWFWTLAADPQQPEASEDLLASMGTVIGQSQTVDGVTATLHGALCDGYHLVLSLSLEGEGLDAATYSNFVDTDASWLAPPRDALEAEMRNQFPNMPEADLQTYMDSYYGPNLPTSDGPSIDYLYDRNTGGRWLLASAPTSPASGETPQELTLHLEDLSFSNTVVDGPFEFTFSIEPKAVARTYTGDVLVEPEDFPALRITEITVTPFRAAASYETVDPVTSMGALQGNLRIDRLRINGQETDIPAYSYSLSKGHENDRIRGKLSSGPFRQVVDSAAVEAVEISGVWVELGSLQAQSAGESAAANET